MSKYFENANINLKIAKECLDNSKKDADLKDAYISKCCYELQQSIEFNIKGLIAYFGNGREFEYKHELEGNVNILQEIKDNIVDFNRVEKILDELIPYIVTVNQWAKESRYNYDFMATLNAIEKVLNIAENLKTYTDELIQLSKKK